MQAIRPSEMINRYNNIHIEYILRAEKVLFITSESANLCTCELKLVVKSYILPNTGFPYHNHILLESISIELLYEPLKILQKKDATTSFVPSK